MTATSKAIAVREPQVLAVSPEALISKAIESGVSVEALEKLLGMRERLKAEQAREAFIDAMAEFQSKCPPIQKNKTATVRSDKGTFTYKYATLDKIIAATSALREECGFSYRFDTRWESNPPAQVVLCIVSHRDGHAEASEFRSPVDSGARMNVMQQSASALTYGKRYAFCNAFGIVADEDNDAQTATSSSQEPGPSPQTPRGASPPAQQAAAPAPAGKNLRVLRAKSSSGGGTPETGEKPTGGSVATPLDDAQERERAFQLAKDWLQRQGSEGDLGSEASAFLDRVSQRSRKLDFEALSTQEVHSLANGLAQRLEEEV